MPIIARVFGGSAAPTQSGTGNYVVKVSGNPYMSVAGNLKIDLSIGKRSQASFILHTDTGTHFQQYEQVSIIDQNGTLIFSGYIQNPQEQQYGFQQSLYHTITAIDQHFLADKRVIARVYKNKTCGAMVMDILNTILYQEGVHNGQIFDGLLPSPKLYPSPTLYPNGNVGAIPSTTFAYCTVAAALDALATAASANGIPYYWMIDEQKNLFFAPYTAFVNNEIVDGTQVWQDPSTNACIVSRQNPLYRNREYLTGGVSQTPQQFQTFVGDGNATSWTLNYAVASQPAVLLSIQGGPQYLTQTIGIKGTTGSEYYWSPGDAVITQDSGLPKLLNTQTLTIIYIGQFPTVISTQNDVQIIAQARLDGTSGIIEAVDEDKTLTDAASGTIEASQLLTRYGVSGTQIKFTTLNSTYRPGRLITVDLPQHALNKAQMLIETVEISDQTDNYNIWYTITAVMGPYDTTWVQFFSKLLNTSHTATNISVGSSVTPPTAPTLVLSNAAMRFGLWNGTTLPRRVVYNAMMRFGLKAANAQSITQTSAFSITPTITVTPSTSTGGTFKTFSGPNGSCASNPPSGKSPIPTYHTSSNQAIRIFEFSDDYNQAQAATNQYTYGGNILLYWSDIETSEGVYDWTHLENALNLWSTAGKKSIVRISTCGQNKWTSSPPPGAYAPKAGQGTPSWVLSAMGSNSSYKCASDGISVVPAYWNSTFQAKFQAFVTKFGQVYNGDSRIEFIQAAMGMGGECKCDTTATSCNTSVTTYSQLKGIGYSDANWYNAITQMIQYYITAFPTTKLGIQTAACFFEGAHKEQDVVAYAISTKRYGLQNDGIGNSDKSSGGWTQPNKNWTNALFISCEQRNSAASSTTGETLECDIECMIAYCQQSTPIYIEIFKDDLLASGNQSILANYASPF